MTGSGSGQMRNAFRPPCAPNPAGETGAGADEGFVRPPNPQSWGRQEQGQMTGSGSGQMRNSFGPRAPNPGGDRSRGR